MSKTNAEGFPLIGWLVTWSTRDFSIERQELVKALEDADIDAGIAKEVLPKNAALRAVKDTLKNIPESEYKRLRFKAIDSETVMVVVIAEVQTDENNNSHLKQISKVTFDKSTRAVKVEGKYKKDIESYFETRKTTYAGDQFRSIVLRYVKRQCSAITYLETGNVYLVPISKEDEFKKVQKLFSLLAGKGVSLNVKEEISTKQTRGVFWDVTVGELTNQVRRMKEDLVDLNSKDSVKRSTAIDRMGKYGELRLKLELYEGALQQKALDLRADLDSLEATAKKLVTA